MIKGSSGINPFFRIDTCDHGGPLKSGGKANLKFLKFGLQLHYIDEFQHFKKIKPLTQDKIKNKSQSIA